MLRPSIGIDWDDVTAPFNSIAIRMANEKYHPKEPYRMEEITSWANEGRTSVIKEFYNDPELYRRQIPTEETKRGIRRLMQIADPTLCLLRSRMFFSLLRCHHILWECGQNRS